MAMHRMSALYAIDRELATYLPFLTPRLRQGLGQWVVGTVVAENGCQDAVTAALGPRGNPHTRRLALRECLYDDGDRITSWGPGQELDVKTCFPALLRWVRAWWVPAGREAAESLWLAADPTPLQDRLVALVVRVLYRHHAIPVAWAIVGAHEKTSWHDHFPHLLRLLAPAVPPDTPVHVRCDMGLNRRSLWDPIVALGWHPCVRYPAHLTFRPQDQVPRCAPCQRRRPCRQGCGLRLRARALPGGQGGYGVGAGTAFRDNPRPCTLVALHGGQAPQPWLLRTDQPRQRSLLRSPPGVGRTGRRAVHGHPGRHPMAPGDPDLLSPAARPRRTVQGRFNRGHAQTVDPPQRHDARPDPLAGDGAGRIQGLTCKTVAVNGEIPQVIADIRIQGGPRRLGRPHGAA